MSQLGTRVGSQANPKAETRNKAEWTMIDLLLRRVEDYVNEPKLIMEIFLLSHSAALKPGKLSPSSSWKFTPTHDPTARSTGYYLKKKPDTKLSK